MKLKILALLGTLAALTGCEGYGPTPPPPPFTPNPPGGVYRAVGTEPFWDMTIDERQMIFTDRGNNVQVNQPTPRVIIGIAGEIYQTPRLGVNIVHRQCSDGMSDRVYPDTVQVDVDGRRYNGCGGGAVAPTSLVGSNWRVASVNGRPTPPVGNFSVNFEADRLGARFGCNTMGGLYRHQAMTLTVLDLSQTLMGCPEPSATFEREGAATLSKPMTMSWSGGDRLTLSNAAGRIELTRSY